MAYIRKNSTSENIFYDATLQKSFSVTREAELESLIFRKNENAIKHIDILEANQIKTPGDYVNIDQLAWEDMKTTVLNNLTNYQSVFTSLYKRTTGGVIHAWNETTKESCTLTDPQNLSIGFLVFSGAEAEREITIRKNELANYESILDAELNQRKLDLLAILQAQ